MKASARAAAKRFYGLYATSHYATLWSLLAPATKREVTRKAWIGVHEACSAASAGKSRDIKAVTVFGNAAIVAETVTGVTPGTVEDVFNYVERPLAVLASGSRHLPAPVRDRRCRRGEGSRLVQGLESLLMKPAASPLTEGEGS